MFRYGSSSFSNLVPAAVNCARGLRMKVSPAGNRNGTSMAVPNEAVVIDLSHMREVRT